MKDFTISAIGIFTNNGILTTEDVSRNHMFKDHIKKTGLFEMTDNTCLPDAKRNIMHSPDELETKSVEL